MDSRFLKASHFYRTEPVGPAGQPDYINAAAAIETTLSPIALLDALQAIESDQGRVRSIHWGSRELLFRLIKITAEGDIGRDGHVLLPVPEYCRCAKHR
jgi:2-amino-4-hydroxy-6-hydroxymethyldihydropteridine diphosphokinase